MPAELQTVLDDVRAQLACDDEEQRKQLADALIKRCQQVAERDASRARSLKEAERASFTRYLTEAVLLCNSAIVFQMRSTTASLRPIAYRAARSKATSSTAIRLPPRAHGAGAFIIILSGCLVWIYSARPTAARQFRSSVSAARCSAASTPAPHLVKYIIGSIWGVVISLLYSFALLPQVSDFAVLVAVLAPAYLLAGSLQARPPTTFMAMGITLTLPVLSELARATAAISPPR